MWIFLASLGGDDLTEIGYIGGTALIAISVWYSVFQNTTIFLWTELGSKIRIALTGIIYQKVHIYTDWKFTPVVLIFKTKNFCTDTS